MKDYESAVTDFLSRPENLELALDIESELPAVRERLINKFWAGLAEKIRERLSGENSWLVEEDPREDYISLRPSHQQPEARTPQFAITMENVRGNGYGYYGLHWNRKVGDSERAKLCAVVPEVAKLLALQVLQGQGWKRPEEWWAAWKYLDINPITKTNLMRIAKGDPVGAEVAHTLIEIFEQVSDHVISANGALVNAYGTGRL